MTKPFHQRKIRKSKVTTQKGQQTLDYTAIAGRLKTMSWSKDSHQTRVDKKFNEIQTFRLTAEAV